jgi:Cdc6-like AAA superfamily ATPase
MFGIINVNVISKGRGGRMREIKLVINKDILEKAKSIITEAIKF